MRRQLWMSSLVVAVAVVVVVGVVVVVVVDDDVEEEGEDEEDSDGRQIRYAAEGDTQLAGDEAWAADTDNTNFTELSSQYFQ